jgi:hypothetical protein
VGTYCRHGGHRRDPLDRGTEFLLFLISKVSAPESSIPKLVLDSLMWLTTFPRLQRCLKC